MLNLFTGILIFNAELVITRPELDDVGVVELAEVTNISLHLLLHLLDGHLLPRQLATEDGALSARAEPRQVLDSLKRNLPVICNQKVFYCLISMRVAKLLQALIITIASSKPVSRTARW